jgi:hypothetical protein
MRSIPQKLMLDPAKPSGKNLRDNDLNNKLAEWFRKIDN